MRPTKYHICILIIASILLASCTRYKNLVYLQSQDSDPETYMATPPSYRIQLRDILYINILSLNLGVSEVINANTGFSSSQFTNDASLYIYGYNVDDSGFVEIPVIGKVNVLNKTLEEAKTAISSQASIYLKDATITVKLISFKYSVFGEVNNPGIYQNYNNQLTVLEAISNAGDLSEFGDRRRILVIRPGNNGTKTFRLNLTNTQILNSEGFFLLPNDIIYVEPVKSYNFRTNLPVLSAFLSGISTLILVLNYVETR